jgi:phospholipid-binding lipoprotein MlaA
MLSFIFLVYNRASADPSSPESQTVISVPQQEKTPPIEQAKPAVKVEPEQKPAELGKASAEPEISEEEKEEATIQIADPIRPWNNAMYHFNDKLYFWVLKPVSKGYSAVIPEDMRIAVSNFFDNITTPVRFVSSILQLKIGNAGNELLRFVYNSTAGVCGLADAAKADFGVPRQEEDLGQALGSYGIGHGFYIVWPFFGPSSLRDTVGLVGDTFLDPVTYVNPLEASVGITAYDEVNTVSLHIGDYEDLKKSAVDPYVSIRDAYLQYRKKKVEE